ncbi:hypothetical protein JMJ56_26010 [Belnapia sp. T18]|uniref:Uncharacterized protein n=1 Tax=Belnapia arida TaxID=2804533 RepID=A0ABS1U9U1_9PROT|nr:hypothetical protein [Belnapia arida]MBL6081451.1 hypothetical protein [Belnapia arida]
MIFRPFTSLCLVAFLGAGMHVYSTKHEAAVMDRELRSIARKVEEAEARTQTLQAEWAWLNEPERLRAVAQRHLPELEAMQPAQFVRASEAERRLPAVAAYEGPVALFAPREPALPSGNTALALLPRVAEPVQVAVVAPKPLAAPMAAPAPVVAPASLLALMPAVPELDLAALPLPPPEPVAPPPLVRLALPVAPPPLVRLALPVAKPVEAAPPRPALVDLARATLPRPAEARPVELPRAAEPARPAQLELARATLPPPRPAPKPVARPAEIAALPPVAAPARAPMASPVTQVAVSAAPRVVPMQPAVAPARAAAVPAYPAPGGSALGLGGGQPLLPPPVPFGSASAATLNGGMGR